MDILKALCEEIKQKIPQVYYTICYHESFGNSFITSHICYPYVNSTNSDICTLYLIDNRLEVSSRWNIKAGKQYVIYQFDIANPEFTPDKIIDIINKLIEARSRMIMQHRYLSI